MMLSDSHDDALSLNAEVDRLKALLQEEKESRIQDQVRLKSRVEEKLGQLTQDKNSQIDALTQQLQEARNANASGGREASDNELNVLRAASAKLQEQLQEAEQNHTAKIQEVVSKARERMQGLITQNAESEEQHKVGLEREEVLKRDLEERNQSTIALQAELSRVKADVELATVIRAELDAEKSRAAVLEADLENVNGRASDLQQLLDDSNSTGDALRRQFSNLQAERDEAIASAEATRSELERQLLASRRSTEAEKYRADELQASCANSADAMQAEFVRAAELQIQLQAAIDSKDALRMELDDLGSSISMTNGNADAAREGLEKQLEASQCEVGRVTDAIRAATADLEREKTRADHLQSLCNETKTEADRAQTDAARVSELQQQLQAATDSKDVLLQQLEDLRSNQLETTRREVASVTEAFKSATAELAAEKVRFIDLQALYSAKQNEAEAARLETARANELQDQLQTVMESKDALQQQLGELRSSIGETNGNADAAREDFEKQMFELNKSTESLENQLKTAQGEASSMTEAIQASAADLAAEKSRADHMQALYEEKQTAAELAQVDTVRVDELQGQLEAANYSKDALQQQLEELRRYIGDINGNAEVAREDSEKQVFELTSLTESLENQLKTVQGEVSSMNETIQANAAALAVEKTRADHIQALYEEQQTAAELTQVDTVRINELQEQLQAATNSKDALQQQLDEYHSSIGQANSNAEAVREALERQVLELRSSTQCIEQQLDAAKGEVARTNDAFETASADLAAERARLVDMQALCDARQKDSEAAESMTARANELQEQLQAANDSREAMRQQVEELRMSMSGTDGSTEVLRNDLEKQVVDLKNLTQLLEKQLEAATEEVVSVTEANNAASSQLAVEKARADELQVRYDEATTTNGTLQVKVFRVDELQQQLEERTDSVQTLRQHLDDLQRHAGNADQTATAEHEDLERQLLESTSLIKNLETQLGAAKAATDVVYMEGQSTSAELSVERSRVASLQDDVSNLKQEAAIASQEARLSKDGLQTDLDQTRQELEQTVSVSKDLQTKLETKSEWAKQLEESLATLRSQLSDVASSDDANRNDLSNQLAEAKSQKENLLAEASAERARADELQGQLQEVMAKARERCQELISRSGEANENSRLAEERAEDLERQMADIKHSAEMMEKNLAQMKFELDTERERVADVRSQLQAAVGASDAEKQDVLAQLEETSKKSNAFEEEIEKLKAGSESAQTAQRVKAEVLQKKLDQAATCIKTLTEELTKTKGGLHAASAASQTTLAELAAERERADRMQSQVSGATSLTVKLQDDLKMSSMNQTKYERQLQEAHNATAVVQGELQKTKAGIAGIEAKLELSRAAALQADRELLAERRRAMEAVARADQCNERAADAESWLSDAVALAKSQLVAEAGTGAAPPPSPTMRSQPFPLVEKSEYDDGDEGKVETEADLRARIRDLEGQLLRSEKTAVQLQGAAARATQQLQISATKRMDLESRLDDIGLGSGGPVAGQIIARTVLTAAKGVSGVARATSRCMRPAHNQHQRVPDEEEVQGLTRC